MHRKLPVDIRVVRRREEPLQRAGVADKIKVVADRPPAGGVLGERSLDVLEPHGLAAAELVI